LDNLSILAQQYVISFFNTCT